MNTSGNNAQYDETDDVLSEKILQIGGGELDYWKQSVLSDEKLFEQVYQLIFSENDRLAWRSGWIIDNAAEKYPEMLAKLIPTIVDQFVATKNSSLKRIFARILTRYELPDEYLGKIVNRCFDLLSPSEPIAVKVNAMQVLFNIARQQPDLKQELLVVLENLIEEEASAGFINRAQKLIARLRAMDSLSRRKKLPKLYPTQR